MGDNRTTPTTPPCICAARRARLRAGDPFVPVDAWSARSSCCCGRTAASTSCTVPPTSRASPTATSSVGGPSGERPAPRSDGPARRRALRLRARAASARAGHIAGVDEAGRGACAGPLVAGAAILRPGKAGEIPGWPTPSCSPRRRASAATPRSCGGRCLVGGGHRVRGVRPARHARRERRGAAPGGRAARRPARVRPHRRLPGRRPRRPRARGVEGRPGRRLHRGRRRCWPR